MKSLKERWLTEEGKKTHQYVLNGLLENIPLEKINGLEKYDGRWDLRGISLPSPKVLNPFSFDKYTISKIKDVFKVANTKLTNVDFSFSHLNDSQWENCSFDNVFFENTKAIGLRIRNCGFNNVVFKKADFKDSLMGGAIGNESGFFKNSQFISADLRGTVYSFPLIEDCNFINCKLNKVNFNGSRFFNCKFAGRLHQVFFRGHPLLGIHSKLNPKKIINPMKNIDFTEAILDDNVFIDDLDLSSCKFPTSDNYLIIKKNKIEVFRHARNIIESEWNGDDKKIGLVLIDQFYLDPCDPTNL